MDDRRAGPEVVAGVVAGQRVHGIGSQLAAFRGLRNRLTNLFLQDDLIDADRRLDLEGRHAGVLTDRAFAVSRQIDVLRDHRQRLRRLRARLLLPHGDFHRRAHIRWKIGGGPNDQRDHAVEKR